jgi:hypothetical protein
VAATPIYKPLVHIWQLCERDQYSEELACPWFRINECPSSEWHEDKLDHLVDRSSPIVCDHNCSSSGPEPPWDFLGQFWLVLQRVE